MNIENNKILNMIIALFTSMKRSGDWGMTQVCKLYGNKENGPKTILTCDRLHALYSRLQNVNVIYNPSTFNENKMH